MSKGMIMVYAGISGIGIMFIWGIVSLIRSSKKKEKYDSFNTGNGNSTTGMLYNTSNNLNGNFNKKDVDKTVMLKNEKDTEFLEKEQDTVLLNKDESTVLLENHQNKGTELLNKKDGYKTEFLGEEEGTVSLNSKK